MRFALALACALTVFVLTYAAAWTSMRNEMDFRATMFTAHDFHRIRDYMALYHLSHSTYPDLLQDVIATIDEFKDRRHLPFTRGSFPELHDYWENPFQYRKTETGYELCTWGRDGKPGGVGLDADVCANTTTTPIVRPSFWQFLYESPGSKSLFRTALITSVCAAAIVIRTSRPRPGIALSAFAFWRNLGLITISSSAVAIFLAYFYIQASQSGH